MATMNQLNLTLAGSIMAAIAVPGVAQTARNEGSDRQRMIENIVVTAQKREQSLQDIGMSVTALSGEALANKRISSLADIALAVPGLEFTQSTSNTPVYTLRGVGFYDASLASYPDVATYIDQVPLPFPVTSTLTAFDLQRIEVLKGPQGTLFGNNATGGAINFVPAAPEEEFGGGFNLSYGRFDTTVFDGYVTGAIADNVNARLALRQETSDAWQSSYTTDDELGEKDNIAMRLLVDIFATEDLTLKLNLNGWRNEDEPQAPQYFKAVPQNAPGAPGPFTTVPVDLPIFSYPLAPQDPRDADFGAGGRPYSDNDFWQGAFRADYNINESTTFTSITSYLDTNIDERLDTDGTNLEVADLANRRGSIESFSQELRVEKLIGDKGRILVGANYERTDVYEENLFLSGDSTSGDINQFEFATFDSDQELENMAIFGNLEYKITEDTTLKVGARYTEAERSTVSRNREDPQFNDSYPIGVTQFFNIVWGSLGFIYPNYQAINRGESFVIDNRLDAEGTPLNPETYGTAGPFRGTLDEDNVSWSIGLDHQLTEDTLLYANISKGYKAGSFPALAGATFTQYEGITQESLLSYEAGFKSQFLDNRLMLNGAAFYYDYEDKQLRSKKVDGIFGLLDALVNVPESEVFGLEFEAMAVPVEGLTLSLAGTYLDTEVTKYDGTVGSDVDPNTGLRVGVSDSFAGAELPFSPEWQLTAAIDYERPIYGNYVGFIGMDVSAQAESVSILTNVPIELEDYSLPDRTIVGARLGIRSEEDTWSLSLWGRNIFDEYYVTSTTISYDNLVRYAGRPAEYGITFGLKF